MKTAPATITKTYAESRQKLLEYSSELHFTDTTPEASTLKIGLAAGNRFASTDLIRVFLRLRSISTESGGVTVKIQRGKGCRKVELNAAWFFYEYQGFLCPLRV